MAFSKKAFANVVHPNWGTQNWQRFQEEHRRELVGGQSRTASASPNLVAQASEILQDQFSPEKYLLTHATIVASVDTSDVPGIRLGAVSEMGRNINRKWANYRVKPGTDIYINNNHDCWDRPVLLNSYRTFVGAHNFVEHVQIEEQSKGRIIDAVARDIGDSIYVDILLATNRAHGSLVRDIEADRMGTLSMGCSVTETQCTKCGNVAADETEMCEHIKYAKGNYEYDANGNKFRIAELCGHHTLDPNAGVTFIEASWVAIPAFQGAVKRNVLQPESISLDTRSQMRQVLDSVPPQWGARDEGVQKAARIGSPAVWPRVNVAQEDPMAPPPEGGEEGGDPMAPPPEGGDAGGMPDPMAPGGMPGAPGAEPEKDPLEELEGDIEKYVLDKIKKKLKEKMQEETREDAASDGELATSTNENINHQASVKLAAGLDTLLRVARSDIELLDGLARLNESHSIKFSREMYRTACRVGSTDKHPSLEMYLRRCAEVLTRQPTVGEAKTLVRLGRILSLRKKTRF
jgi:hypothetical protein